MDKNNRASVVAIGGLLTTLSVLCIYLSSYLPTNKIFLQALATCLIMVGIVLTGVKNSTAIYLASAILSLLLCGIRFSTVAYIVFFGLYGFVKQYVERLDKTLLEYIAKLLYFNLCIFVLIILYRFFMPAIFNIKIPLYVFAVALQIIFLIYDYALSAFISYFKKKFPKLKI